MNAEYRKKWIVTPDRLPEALRKCPRCGGKSWFENSGRFRVNANGRALDVWLIFRCKICKATWNMAIYQRVEMSAASAAYRVQVIDTPVPCGAVGWSEVQILLPGCLKLRVDVLFAGQMGISRVKARQLCERGLIRGQEGNVRAGNRVRDGQVFCFQAEEVCTAG